MTAVEDFRRLHDDFLLLPNAWDVASASALAREGFPAVGTTSLGVAAAAGVPDGTGAGRGPTLALAHALAGQPVPITVDIEGGFSEDPGELRDLAAELAALGIAGVNIEDGQVGALRDPAHHARLVAAMATSDLFVNARTDTYWSNMDKENTLDRLRAYVDAGASGVFVPGLTEPQDIEKVVSAIPAPLNILFQPGKTNLQTLAALGVRRVSTGSYLFRAALGAALDAARMAKQNAAPLTYDIPTYQQVQSLVP
jgi:2-methylisocitrate lyase-like PEP mutase family enzyme